MRLFWKTLEMVLAGAVAVSILHIEKEPTYLMLFFGWVALINAIVAFAQLGIAFDAIINKTEARQ